MTANWRDVAVGKLKRNDIVLMHAGHLRVVTDIRPSEFGHVHVRLGSTWYRLPADRMVAVDRKGPSGVR
ncbi:hypothetical protein KIK06_24515 [Nocardiopsis sp. EMB25]|uniref:hypothetical protein n=1 Tax=Nocardiopsis sp. EMB25 TaxID=2835867 RepID=UPI00228396DF|nr:hypothetical protein [Nocardiopsis sp. EMB25]MCY9787052.1 hypothetical protein [Nocardiopsis sp. EMB25]